MMASLGAIYAARRDARLDDDAARDVYEKATGKRSLTAMTPREQVTTLNALRALTGPAAAVDGPYGKKLQALWISGWHLGVVRDRNDRAMLSFVARQTGIEATRFLRDAADARKAVEALKGWLAREADVRWSEYRDPMDAVLGAQGRLLYLDRLDPTDDQPIAQAWFAFRLQELNATQKREAMRLFGDAVRRRK